MYLYIIYIIYAPDEVPINMPFRTSSSAPRVTDVGHRHSWPQGVCKNDPDCARPDRLVGNIQCCAENKISEQTIINQDSLTNIDFQLIHHGNRT